MIYRLFIIVQGMNQQNIVKADINRDSYNLQKLRNKNDNLDYYFL